MTTFSSADIKPTLKQIIPAFLTVNTTGKRTICYIYLPIYFIHMRIPVVISYTTNIEPRITAVNRIAALSGPYMYSRASPHNGHLSDKQIRTDQYSVNEYSIRANTLNLSSNWIMMRSELGRVFKSFQSDKIFV